MMVRFDNDISILRDVQRAAVTIRLFGKKERITQIRL